MIFSSVTFLFCFLPIVLLLYYMADSKYRNIILVISSLIFYACGEGLGVLIMIGSICVNYISGILIDKVIYEKKVSKIILFITVALNLGVLYVFKYLDYTIEVTNYVTGKQMETFNIALPIGISFFTFQAMSYVVDVYRRDVKVAKNPIEVALYVSFFPQLIAGPIVRYNTISEQIKIDRKVDLEKIGGGAKRFLIGFSKKVLLANNLAAMADWSFKAADLHATPVLTAWISSLAYSLQIYYDFSGYSDMAIGLGKMFGFDFQENFNYPYISASITEFWRRWHISLSQWFRDYVYIPLGGSRVVVSRQILNLFVVWLLTGIWHGANVTFVLWGLLYFMGLIFEKYVLKPEKRGKVIGLIWRVLTLLLVNINWMLFNSDSIKNAGIYMKSMLGLYGNVFYDDKTFRMLNEYGCFFFAGVLFSMPMLPKLEKGLEKTKVGKAIHIFVFPLIYVFFFLWGVSYLVLGAYNPFIYFNF